MRGRADAVLASSSIGKKPWSRGSGGVRESSRRKQYPVPDWPGRCASRGNVRHGPGTDIKHTLWPESASASSTTQCHEGGGTLVWRLSSYSAPCRRLSELSGRREFDVRQHPRGTEMQDCFR